MLDIISHSASISGLLPHGYCFLWFQELLLLHVIADGLIALAYYSIPVALLYFAHRRADLHIGGVLALFAVFIVACGTTHAFEIWTIWQPDYWTEGVIKAITAIASLGTAIMLWLLMPKALAWPSPEQLRLINTTLQLESQERQASLEALQRESEEKRKTLEALAESEQRFRSLVEGVKDHAFFRLDPAGKVIDWNQSGEQLLGYRAENIIGRHFSYFYTERDRQLRRPEYALEKALADDHADNRGWQVRQDNSRFQANQFISPLRNEDGALQGFSVVVRDVTERVRAEQELETFSYSVSHDLRAPLRAIRGFSQILVRRHNQSLNEEGRHYLDNVVQASAQLEAITEDLLEYARLGRTALKLQPVALQDIVSQALSNLQDQIQQARAEITLPEASPILRSDPTLLLEIMTNLLENAIKYHKPDTPPRITVAWQTESNGTILSVADNGIGIASEYLHKIFNVFQRLHGQDAYPGTGIGLAIVNKTTELLGGRAWVESTPDIGSTFYIKLPGTPLIDRDNPE